MPHLLEGNHTLSNIEYSDLVHDMHAGLRGPYPVMAWGDAITALDGRDVQAVRGTSAP